MLAGVRSIDDVVSGLLGLVGDFVGVLVDLLDDGRLVDATRTDDLDFQLALSSALRVDLEHRVISNTDALGLDAASGGVALLGVHSYLQNMDKNIEICCYDKEGDCIFSL